MKKHDRWTCNVIVLNSNTYIAFKTMTKDFSKQWLFFFSSALDLFVLEKWKSLTQFPSVLMYPYQSMAGLLLYQFQLSSSLLNHSQCRLKFAVKIRWVIWTVQTVRRASKKIFTIAKVLLNHGVGSYTIASLKNKD